MRIKLTLDIFIFNLYLLGQVIGIRGSDCGIVQFIEAKINSGTQISKGEWPFIVALYYLDEAKFFCGGTIISARHVLTAAHCVQQKNSDVKLTPEEVVVLLGAYNLDVRVESSVQQKEVAEIHVHSDWKVFSEKYDADIAIFVLKEPMVFTSYIRPVCIPEDDDAFPDVKGSIVGWGLTENTTKPAKHESIPRHAFTTALNDSYCYTTNRFIAIFSSTRTFCGGGEGGAPNKGDSGGGFFVQIGTIWVQYGIVSASLSDSSGVVLPDTFSVYTNVKSFRKWINGVIHRENVGVIQNGNADRTKAKIQSYCNFEYTSFYTCSVWEANITNPNLDADTFRGTHPEGYSNENVTQIWFWHGKVEYIPDGIGLQFQNLEKFLVGYVDKNLGLKQIKRSNFKDMPSLTLIQLHDNYIETVEVDVLWDLPNLEYFILMNGQLKELPEMFFDKNTKLRSVNGDGNQIEYLPMDLFKNNPLLEEIHFTNNKLRSISTDFSTLIWLKIIDFHGNSCFDRALSDVDNLTDYLVLIGYYC